MARHCSGLLPPAFNEQGYAIRCCTAYIAVESWVGVPQLWVILVASVHTDAVLSCLFSICIWHTSIILFCGAHKRIKYPHGLRRQLTTLGEFILISQLTMAQLHSNGRKLRAVMLRAVMNGSSSNRAEQDFFLAVVVPQLTVRRKVGEVTHNRSLLTVFCLSLGCRWDFFLFSDTLSKGSIHRSFKGVISWSGVRSALHGVRSARWLVGLSSNATNNSDLSSLCTLTL